MTAFDRLGTYAWSEYALPLGRISLFSVDEGKKCLLWPSEKLLAFSFPSFSFHRSFTLNRSRHIHRMLPIPVVWTRSSYEVVSLVQLWGSTNQHHHPLVHLRVFGSVSSFPDFGGKWQGFPQYWAWILSMFPVLDGWMERTNERRILGGCWSQGRTCPQLNCPRPTTSKDHQRETSKGWLTDWKT